MTKKAYVFIYLQWEEWSEDEGVTWCQDKINDTDVEYIRKDVHDRLVEDYDKLKKLCAKMGR